MSWMKQSAPRWDFKNIYLPTTEAKRALICALRYLMAAGLILVV